MWISSYTKKIAKNTCHHHLDLPWCILFSYWNHESNLNIFVDNYLNIWIYSLCSDASTQPISWTIVRRHVSWNHLWFGFSGWVWEGGRAKLILKMAKFYHFIRGAQGRIQTCCPSLQGCPCLCTCSCIPCLRLSSL